MKKIFFLFVFIVLAGYLPAQITNVTPKLVGSAGGLATSATMTISYSVGETVIPTVTAGSLILTEGFQQPLRSVALGLNATMGATDLSCIGANDGKATATILSGTGPFSYSWNTVPVQRTPVATNLKPGWYVVTITDANNFIRRDSVNVRDNTSICGIHVYSGLSPNGDGKNDIWYIDYINLFLPNTVSIYNRWGDKVWGADNYDNSSVVWRGLNFGGEILPNGTYYYVLRIGEKEQKGWVELSR